MSSLPDGLTKFFPTKLCYTLTHADIDECAKENHNGCNKPAVCINTLGSYYCKCPQGYKGHGTLNDPCIPDPNTNNRGLYKLLIGTIS